MSKSLWQLVAFSKKIRNYQIGLDNFWDKIGQNFPKKVKPLYSLRDKSVIFLTDMPASCAPMHCPWLNSVTSCRFSVIFKRNGKSAWLRREPFSLTTNYIFILVNKDIPFPFVLTFSLFTSYPGSLPSHTVPRLLTGYCSRGEICFIGYH